MTSTPNHTPGPWKVEPDSELAYAHPYHRTRFITTVDFDQDANMGEIICRMSDAPNQAQNAALIAAAPELLDALRCLVEADPRTVGIDHYNRAVSDARATIAKATGNG